MTPNRITRQSNIEGRACVYLMRRYGIGSEGSREREDWMSEVKDNIRPGLGEDWV